eukprot:scaffold51909_cov30-Cyclotella_meneghiniana.AAC.1
MSPRGIRLRRAREAYDYDEPERQTITTSPRGRRLQRARAADDYDEPERQTITTSPSGRRLRRAKEAILQTNTNKQSRRIRNATYATHR